MNVVLVAILLLGTAGSALAHVTLEIPEATVGDAYKAVFRVGHGCEGAPTTAIRVRVPEGVVNAKPMPKPGWTLATQKGAYAASYDYYGTQLSEGVKEVVWSGGELPDDFYDEFVMRVYLTPGLPTTQALFFPVVQECTGGKTERWIEIPAAGKNADDYETPAPGLTLRPKN